MEDEGEGDDNDDDDDVRYRLPTNVEKYQIKTLISLHKSIKK